MKVFIGERDMGENMWTFRVFHIFARLLEKKSDWQVLRVGHNSVKDIRSKVLSPDTTVVMFTFGRLTHKIMDRILPQCKCKIVHAMDDTNRPEVWKSGTKFCHAICGPGLMRDPEFAEVIRKFWPEGKSFELCPLYNGIPYVQEFNDREKKKPQVIFPSRNFLRKWYPFRVQWKNFICSRPDLASQVSFLHLSDNFAGKAYVDHIGSFKACLVVIPKEGYLVAKLFEAILGGSILLVYFPPGIGEVSRREWISLGFVEGSHYLEVTFETFPMVLDDVMGGKYNDLPRKAFDFAMANHRIETNRFEDFLSFANKL